VDGQLHALATLPLVAPETVLTTWSGAKSSPYQDSKLQPLSHPAYSQLEQKFHKMKSGENMY
jgi:hypothetical protein